jgi:hypothetical protein
MGEQTLEETTKKLDINVDNYNHIYKLIKWVLTFLYWQLVIYYYII